MSTAGPEYALQIVDGGSLYVIDGSLAQGRIIDDFEHDNLLLYYTVPSSTGSKRITTAAARSGTFGYESEGFGEVWSHPGRSDPLLNYPAPGTTFEYYFRPNNIGSNQYWFYFGGTQDTDQNRYQIEAIMSGTFRVRKDVNGSRSIVTSQSVSWSSRWYRIEVQWYDGGGWRIRLYPDGSTSLIAQLDSLDDTFAERSKVGYRCGGSGHLYVDDILII